RIALPSNEERTTDINQWMDYEAKTETGYDLVDFPTDYIKELIYYTDYPTFNIEKIAVIIISRLKDTEGNIPNYRNEETTSIVDGTEASIHHTPWMKEMDDSLERYLEEVAVDEKELSKLNYY